MADIHKFSERVIDLAERVEDVADAANGKGIRRGSFGTRWVILPAAGAALYALATSGSLSRQAKGVVDQARTRASELPDDLLRRIGQTSRKATNRNGSQRRRATSTQKRSTARKTASSAR